MANVRGAVSEPGNALEIVCTDRDVWKKRALNAEAQLRDIERLTIAEITRADRLRDQVLAKDRGLDERRDRFSIAMDVILEREARIRELEQRLDAVCDVCARSGR